MQAKKSSIQLRELGNEELKMVRDDYNNQIDKDRLRKAIMLYTQAISVALKDQDKASALKNQAYAKFKLGNVEKGVFKIQYYCQAIQDNLDTQKYDKDQSKEWKLQIRNRIEAIITNFDQFNRQEKDYEIKIKNQIIFNKSFQNQRELIPIYNLCQYYTDYVQYDMDQGLFLKAQSQANYGLEQSKTLLHLFSNKHENYLDLEIQTKELDITLMRQLLTCQSIISRENVELRLKKLKEEDLYEIGEFHFVLYEIIDQLKSTIHQSISGSSILDEVRAKILLAHIYYDFLKNKKIARDVIKNAIELSVEFLQEQLKNLEQYDWYKDAKQLLQKIRDDDLLDEQLKEEYMKGELKESLDQLKEIIESTKSHQEKIKLVLQKFPPKIKTVVFVKEKDENNKNDYQITDEMLKRENMKKTLIKMISFYHFDKQPKHDVKWVWFSTEITKTFTNMYEDYK